MGPDDAIAARRNRQDPASARSSRGLFGDVRRVTETGSTNTDVLAMARDGAAEGLVLVADHQTAGRGRAGRTWTAPHRASLLCTVLLRPPAPRASLVTFALAVAAAEAVEAVAGVQAGLKWPNDLVVEDGDRTRKLAGILAEAEWPAGAGAAVGHREPLGHERATVAAGIGLNVAWPEDMPEDLAEIAVSLNHLSDASFDRDDVLEAMLDRLEETYGLLVAGETEALLDRWRARSATLRRRVRVDLGSSDLTGTAVDITDAGQLVVDDDDGERRVLAVGDVVHLRPV